MGIGGLHSSEKSCYHVATDKELLLDRDVASYYPRIILNGNLYPEQLTPVFLKVYNDIVERRLKAKHEGDKVTADALKITINGSFGKFGSPYSKLYSPELLLAVTITGQLSLLLFIEMLESYGIRVVSANTDGIVIKCPIDKYETYLWVTQEWERITSFETEETQYKAIYSRDVNSYFAIKTNGEVKGKGFFSTDKLKKNPKYDIAKTAVIELMKNETSIADTIRNCKDIRQFLSVRSVKGGAHKDGWFLGKAVRWYYANGVEGSIRYISSGNAVPESEGAKPLMELPDTFPEDVNYKRYVIEAERILDDIGWKQLCLF
jgi:DNA polymerase elongation subunit (family B)